MPPASHVSGDPPGDHTLAAISAWLTHDIHAEDAPSRVSVGATGLPPDDALTSLGLHLAAALETGDLSALQAALRDLGLGGAPDAFLLHAAQLLCARLEPVAPAPHHRDRADAIIRTLALARPSDEGAPQRGLAFRELATGLHDTLYSKLPTGQLCHVSPTIEALTGHPPAALLADPTLWASLVLAEDRPQLDEALQTAASGAPAEATYRIRHARTGRIHHLLDRAVPVSTPDGVARIDGILSDRTERVELELRLERSETLRSLGQLARDVAHDFNNLLVSILGHADLLASEFPPATREGRSLRLIAAAAEKGSQLTERLLTFARGSATSRHKTPTDLAPIIAEAADLAAPAAPQGLALDCRIAPDLGLVLADPLRISESLLNLVLNAIHACGDQPGHHVLIEARPASADEIRRIGATFAPGAVTISVTDDGPGMSPDVLARVFEPLFTTRARQGGTGLGCAIAYGVAVDHGGVLEVQSQPGQGARFQFIVPTTDAEPTALAPPPPPPPAARAPAPLAGARENRRILVVDDDPSIRQLIKDLLEGAGFPVDAVPGGEQAIASVDADPASYRLVILDVMMQPMDGTEAFTRLRSRWPELPIIFCTAHSDSGRVNSPGALAEAPVVKKPFRAAHLIRAVRDASAPA
jgi:two-component system cell cycle sensor histidine kinase/response regulator CckA